MIRGTVGAVAVVVLLVASPTAAVAAGSVLAVTVSDPNPAVGKAFTATADAGSCSTVQLDVDAPEGSVTIDGTQAQQLTKEASDGTAEFAVAIDRSGTYSVSAMCGNGEQNADEDDPYYEGGGGPAVVTVGGDGGEVAGTSGGVAGTSAEVAGKEGGILPSTGAEAWTTLLAIAGLLALIGGATVLLLRRRKTA
jgi:LPXTG-motif cell wall-anchored protein